MRKFFVDSGGINLSVNDYGGQGPPVVLLHGVMGRAACWWPVIPGLVTAGFHVFAFDQRGHGHSGRGQPYTVEQLAADTRAVLEQAVSGPAFMIGHSLGGIVALVATATWPHLTRALVIEDIAAHGAHINLPTWGPWFQSWPVPFPSMQQVREFFRGERAGLEGFFQEVFTDQGDGYRPLFRYEDVLTILGSLASRDYWREVEVVTCPALVLRGEKGEFPQADLQELGQRLPRGEFYEVRDAYHVVHHDQPRVWLDTVIDFFHRKESRLQVSARL